MKREHAAALRWAVGRAAEWRGELVGHDHPEAVAALAEFDATVKKAQEALKEVTRFESAMKKLVEALPVEVFDLVTLDQVGSVAMKFLVDECAKRRRKEKRK